MFDVLWTVFLGVIGGIISSVIVSRVFMLQGEYQQQARFVEGIIRRLGMIAGYLMACKAVFEVSYDQDVLIDKEMKEKGYKSEDEYYAAHRDKDWISVKGVLKSFKEHLDQTVEATKQEIIYANITDESLNELLDDISGYLHNISAAKDLNFSVINDLKRNETEVLEKFENCKRIAGKRLVKLVMKDKVMMVLYVLVGLLALGTGLSFWFGW